MKFFYIEKTRRSIELFFVFFVVVFMMTSCVSAREDNNTSGIGKAGKNSVVFPDDTIRLDDSKLASVFHLPNYLKNIEQEAFEGTALQRVEFSETVSNVGEMAFARIVSLQTIRFPDTELTIAQNAFKGSNNAKVIGERGGFAWSWSRKNNTPFVPSALLYINSIEQRFLYGESAGQSSDAALLRNLKNDAERRANRANYEYIRLILEDVTAYHFYTRAPPAFV